MTYKELTKFLRDVRKKQQLKMTDLAVSIGVHTASIGNWEWAGRTPTLFNLQAWANALGYDLEFILTPRPKKHD